jgi:predicted GIY-YIG superfamily endonuclease
MSDSIANNPPWYYYIIENNGSTYVGISPRPVQRLRAHNKEIVGGAKYTRSKGPGWKHVCIVSGFKDKIHCMQFEWSTKHTVPKLHGGIVNRVKKMVQVMNMSKCTTKSCESSSYPLEITWHGVKNDEKTNKKAFETLLDVPDWIKII